MDHQVLAAAVPKLPSIHRGQSSLSWGYKDSALAPAHPSSLPQGSAQATPSTTPWPARMFLPQGSLLPAPRSHQSPLLFSFKNSQPPPALNAGVPASLGPPGRRGGEAGRDTVTTGNSCWTLSWPGPGQSSPPVLLQSPLSHSLGVGAIIIPSYR